MKIAAALIAALCIPSAVFAQEPAPAPFGDRAIVRKNIETVMLASARADTAELARIYAPDYRMGDRAGGTINRFARLRQLAMAKTGHSPALVPAYVRVLGNVAVAGGKMPNKRDEWLQIWEEHAGEWKLSYEEHARPQSRARS
jgi:hypothetical protein